MNTAITDSVTNRRADLLHQHQESVYKVTNRLFFGLFIFQWLAGIIAALCLSPYTYVGATGSLNPHVYQAIFLGGMTIALPLFLLWRYPYLVITRHVVAVAQMLASALLIHVTGGRIETHFHIFGSLAFLAFYRDWRVLITATVVTALDHLLRGMFMPLSIYGVAYANIWRTLEHAAWVVFEDVFLIGACLRSTKEMTDIATQRAELELSNETIAKVDEMNRLFQDGAMNFQVCGLTINTDGTIRTWNEGAENVFVYSAAEIVGQSLDVLYSQEDAQLARHECDQAEQRTRYESSGWRLGKNRKRVNVKFSITAVKQDDGKIKFYSMVLRDQTEQKIAEEKVVLQQKDLIELSTPVLNLWNGILALPIIGTLDSARSQVVMERLLRELVSSGATIAILDISGVPTVDTEVAKYLMNTVSAARLMGAECIISGVRPEIAQTMVHLGVDLSTIKTKSSMARALEYGLTLLNNTGNGQAHAQTRFEQPVGAGV